MKKFCTSFILLLVMLFAFYGDCYALQGPMGSRGRTPSKTEPPKTTTPTTASRRNDRQSATTRPSGRTPGGGRARAPKPPAQGTLAVTVSPADSFIFVNGQRLDSRDENGRLISSTLKPGPYTIRASRPGYDEQTQSIMLEAGGFESLNITLRPMPGSISIKPTIPDSEIVIVNKDKDIFLGRYTGNVTALSVEPGLYEVTISRSGYRTATRHVPVKAGESVYLEPPLDGEPPVTPSALSRRRPGFMPAAATTVEASREGKYVVVTMTGRSGDTAATLGSLDVTVNAGALLFNNSTVTGMLTGFPCRVDFVRIENIAEYAFTEPPGAGNQWSRAIVRIRPKDSKRPIRFSINWKAVESGQGVER